MKDVWVITWNYSDMSGFGLVRAYEMEERAKLDFEMLQHTAGDYKTFRLFAVHCLES